MVRGRVLLGVLGVLLLALALLAVACNGDSTPTPTRTPTRTPTPTATPSPTPLPPISVSSASSIGDLLKQLTSSEQQCIRDALGADVQDLSSGDTNPTGAQLQALLDCDVDLPTGDGNGLPSSLQAALTDCFFDPAAYAAMQVYLSGERPLTDAEIGALALCGFFDVLDYLSGDGKGPNLTADQLQCLRGELAPESRQTNDEGPSLTADERAAFEACGVGLVKGDYDLCILNALGPEFLQRADEHTSLMADEKAALANCRMMISTGDEHDSGSTATQRFLPSDNECIADAIGSDTIDGILSGDRRPTDDERAAFAACGVDISRGEDDSEEPDRTAAQIECLLKSVGAAVLAEYAQRDDHQPLTEDELAAFAACGVKIRDFDEARAKE